MYFLILFIKNLQCNSKSAGEKEMYSLGIAKFSVPGEPGFPLNAMYHKPANKNEEGKVVTLFVIREGEEGEGEVSH